MADQGMGGTKPSGGERLGSPLEEPLAPGAKRKPDDAFESH